MHAKVAQSIFPHEHPFHVRLAKAQRLYRGIGSAKKPHDAKVLQWARLIHFNVTAPGGLKADAPEKDKKVHTMGWAQRFSDFDHQEMTDGSAVLGAGSLSCSYRAECVAMEAGLERLVDANSLTRHAGTRVVEFTDSLSLLMALDAVPAGVEDAILRRICDLILHIARLRLSLNFQFVFSHYGVPRNEAAYNAATQ
ncbi:hypothetical protein TRVL_04559 [Trypanosoma vivax]|nr:hypothetical protein TRVL_04559 [Trypanosoma vivax]